MITALMAQKDITSTSTEDTSEVIDWIDEAEAVIRDIGFAVRRIFISDCLPNSDKEVYFNIETIEGERMCVQLSSSGFKILSNVFDFMDEDFSDKTYYETPYALLDKYSPSFRFSFATELQKKLNDLLETE